MKSLSLDFRVEQISVLRPPSWRPVCLRGDPFITFALRGGRGVKEVANFANDKTDRLRETVNKGGGGGPKSRKFCKRRLSMAPNDSTYLPEL